MTSVGTINCRISGVTKRNDQIRKFLIQTGWGDAARTNLAGDASNRRYWRLQNPDSTDTAVLMDAPVCKNEDVRPFVRIAKHLIKLGFSAPEILAVNEELGFLLLSDLGDDLFAHLVLAKPNLEKQLYSAATDLLISLHHCPVPTGIAKYDAQTAADLAALVFDWYLPGITDDEDKNMQADFTQKVKDVLLEFAPETDVLVLRDYHSENLIWLPNRTANMRVGLLDFQDAMLGHRTYDLVSLLQDARRDVSELLEELMLVRYIEETGQNDFEFRRAYATFGMQRNLRILGVFARLYIRDGKAGYVDFIPRVWNLLQRDLAHPSLSGIAELVNGILPEPSPCSLEKLKSKCAIHRTL